LIYLLTTKKKILFNKTNDSLLLRHSPDGVLLNNKNKLFYFECKSGGCIEKNAYNNYLIWDKILPLIIISKNDKGLCYQFINKVLFKNITILDKYIVDENMWLKHKIKTNNSNLFFKILDKSNELIKSILFVTSVCSVRDIFFAFTQSLK